MPLFLLITLSSPLLPLLAAAILRHLHCCAAIIDVFSFIYYITLMAALFCHIYCYIYFHDAIDWHYAYLLLTLRHDIYISFSLIFTLIADILHYIYLYWIPDTFTLMMHTYWYYWLFIIIAIIFIAITLIFQLLILMMPCTLDTATRHLRCHAALLLHWVLIYDTMRHCYDADTSHIWCVMIYADVIWCWLRHWYFRLLPPAII